MAEALQLRCFTGAAVQPHLHALAVLRMAVFREWPYLYEGNAAYEADYLAAYARSGESLFALAFHGERVVGAATGIPLADDVEALQQPLREHGLDPAGVYYFGESVLLPEYRGQGLGHRFFDERERFALSLQRFRYTGFYSVLRDLGDPRRPADERPLDPFWRRRGYAPAQGVVAALDWQETWHHRPTAHRLQFWLRDWSATPHPP